eukprot:2040158-Heterocapsa_arctica.AAC.1
MRKVREDQGAVQRRWQGAVAGRARCRTRRGGGRWEGGTSGEADPGRMGRRLMVGRALRRGSSSGGRWVDGPEAMASGRRGRGDAWSGQGGPAEVERGGSTRSPGAMQCTRGRQRGGVHAAGEEGPERGR